MYQYKVQLTYGTHYVIADDYSVSGGYYIFWVGKTSVRMFKMEEVEEVVMLGRTQQERPS